MATHVHVLEDWPQPDTVSEATVVKSGSKLVIGYGTGEENYALITFPLCFDLRCGGPNDEALNGHSLYEFGLRYYSVHRKRLPEAVLTLRVSC